MKTVVAHFTNEQDLQNALALLQRYKLDVPSVRGQVITEQAPSFTRRVIYNAKRGGLWENTMLIWSAALFVIGGVGGLLWGLGYLNTIPADVQITPQSVAAAVTLGISGGILLGASVGAAISFFAPKMEDQFWVATRVNPDQSASISIQAPNQRKLIAIMQIFRHTHATFVYETPGARPIVHQLIDADVPDQRPAL